MSINLRVPVVIEWMNPYKALTQHLEDSIYSRHGLLDLEHTPILPSYLVPVFYTFLPEFSFFPTTLSFFREKGLFVFFNENPYNHSSSTF